MSLELVLIPAAIAAVAAIRAARAENGSLLIQTRMKNHQMLLRACQRAGASSTDEELLSASWPDLHVSFRHQEDGTLLAHVRDSDDQNRINEVLLAIDAAYGGLVQEHVINRIQENAERLGMRIESRSDNADSSVTVVLEVLA